MSNTEQTHRGKGRKGTGSRQKASATGGDRKRKARHRKASASDAPDIRSAQVELPPQKEAEPKTVLQSKLDTLIGLLGETQPAASDENPSARDSRRNPSILVIDTARLPQGNALVHSVARSRDGRVAVSAARNRRQCSRRPDQIRAVQRKRSTGRGEFDRAAQDSAAGTGRAAHRRLGGRAIAQGNRNKAMEPRTVRANRLVSAGGQVGSFATMVGQSHKCGG